MKKKKALTLIEVLIALSIFAIVMGIIFPFFTSSLKGFNTTTIRSELQNDGENVIKNISKTAMEAKKVNLIDNIDVESSSATYKIDGTNVKSIEFLSGSDCKNVFELDKGAFYKVLSPGNRVSLGKNVEYIDISPLDGLTFEKSQGIKVKLVMVKNSVNYEISNTLYFRNKR
ncbi:PilW family protein [Clostridium sp. UBA4548]|uniref:PilW family protein n=1 Tax=Clostridium sp. UBA4548 TaxID=1946361 RepID=UPI0025BA93DF|nr:type II secretion system protein [Clostridium sp. UBA4548]